jgi:quinone-modifying oxidoreductase subunit QmoC
MADTKNIQPDLAFIKGVMAAGGDTVNKCYQCATCSVVCPLSTEDRPFPRKEMLWAQWGLASKIAGDADVWLCHQCGDCTAYCPRDARPGDVLGAIRNNAIKYYAEPKALADMFTTTGGVLATVVGSFIIWMIVAFLWSLHTGEKFPFPEGDVKYYKILTFIPIDLVALPIAGLAAWASYKGITAFWNDICVGAGYTSYTGTGPKPALGPLFSKYVVPAVKEILAHSRFEKCGQTKERVKGHKWMLYSFIILFIVTGLVFVINDIIYVPLFHEHFTPMPLWNPIKIAANIGAVLLIGGAWMVRSMRIQKTKEGVLKSSEQDWILIYLIFSVGVTGAAAEIFRLLNIAPVAYPVYILHLATVITLFLALPYSKFAHLLYRTTAYVFQLYEKDMREGKAGFGMEKEVLPPKLEVPEEAEEAAEEAKEEEKKE